MERSIKPIYGTLKTLGIIFAIICVVVGFTWWRDVQRKSNLTPAQKAERDARNREIDRRIKNEKQQQTARAMCWAGLKQTLHDPDSAQAIDKSTWTVLQNGDLSFTVTVQARAKNIFGGYQRGIWQCTTRDEGAQWRVMAIDKVR